MNIVDNHFCSEDRNICIKKHECSGERNGSSEILIKKTYDLHLSPLKYLIDNNILVQTRQNVEPFRSKRKLDGSLNPFIYTAYKFYRPILQVNDNPSKNENDCLEFSEYLTMRAANKFDDSMWTKKLLPYRYDVIVFRGKHLADNLNTNIKCDDKSNNNKNYFGDCDDKNKYIAATYPRMHKNANANPDEGESYAIVLSENNEPAVSLTGKSKYVIPYHVANVIYKIGTINITLSVAENPEVETAQPEFAFFSTEDNKYNFHNCTKAGHDAYYTIEVGRTMRVDTIVIQSRNKDDILTELHATDPNTLTTIGGKKKRKARKTMRAKRKIHHKKTKKNSRVHK